MSLPPLTSLSRFLSGLPPRRGMEMVIPVE
jgi:hypothetical protein